MTPFAALEDLLTHSLVDKEGDPVQIDLLAPMTPEEIDRFAKTLPCSLPAEIRELLAFSQGFEGGVERVQFAGGLDFAHDDLFPHEIALASDGRGNFWVVDVCADSKSWGPIYFVSHDPPILLYQSADLGEFLQELLRMLIPPCESLIDDVHADRIRNVWHTNPDTIEQPDAAISRDPALSAFAKTLESDWLIVDLRKAKPGDGFAWGRFGPKTRLRRAGNLPIFAYRPTQKKPLLGRLLGQ
ncbi:MAG: SMI1/KNR4 family protein [Fimbriimonas sp.]